MAFSQLLPIFKAFGWTFWLVSLSFGLPVLLGVGLFYGVAYNQRYIATFIARLRRGRRLSHSSRLASHRPGRHYDEISISPTSSLL